MGIASEMAQRRSGGFVLIVVQMVWACGGRAGSGGAGDGQPVGGGGMSSTDIDDPDPPMNMQPDGPPLDVDTPPVTPDRPPEMSATERCTNALRDGGETDVDCGGPDCVPCDPKSTCQIDSDCRGGRCSSGVCRDETCFDGVRNGVEAAVDCDGACAPCPVQLAGCPCASSERFTALACGGRMSPSAFLSSDNGVVMFAACTGSEVSEGLDNLGTCDVVRWTVRSSEKIIGGAEPRGLSADGATLLVDGSFAQLWQADGNILQLPVSHGLGLSGDGRVVLGELDNVEGSTPVLWTREGGIELVPIELIEGAAWSARVTTLSGDGQAIVGSSFDEYGQALGLFRWTANEGMRSLGVTPFIDSSWPNQFLVSMDGSVIAGLLDDDPQQNLLHAVAFHWTPFNGAAPLAWRGSEPNQLGRVQGMSADGQRILGTLFDGAVPYLWEEERGVWQLDESLIAAGVSLDGWTLANAVALSSDGRVVIGQGYCGDLHALYRAVLPD